MLFSFQGCKNQKINAFALVVGLLLAGEAAHSACQPLWAEDRDIKQNEWPQFLGPNRTGLSSEIDLLEEWPENGLKIIWRVPGGVGMSGLSISRGRVLTMVQREGQQWVIAVDAVTGRSIWQTAVAKEYGNPMGDGPRATPTISGDRVFVLSGDGVVSAIDFESGALLWSHNTLVELSGKVAEYGMASSPLVIDDQVIVIVGAAAATLAAFDTKTGKLVWTAGDDPAGYSSPMVLVLDGVPHIVSYSGNSVLGVAFKTGQILWRYPFQTNYECNIATPLSIRGKLFLSAGENHGSVLLNVKSMKAGYEFDELWQSFGPKSVLRSEWQTPLLIDGFLYGMDNVGGAGPVTHLTCIDAMSGERMWQMPRFGKGNMIAADGKLFVSTLLGELVVVKISPEKYDEVGRMNIVESTRQSPSIAGGFLYLRDGREIVCVDVRKPSLTETPKQ